MSFISKSCRLMLLHVLLVILLFLSGCTGIGSSTLSTSFTFPALPIIRKFDLSARQGLRDRAGDFSVHAGGADTSNAGSFHIRVLVITPGKFAGLWNGLEDKFIVQGTSMTLSVQVFAQNATVEKVQFTVTVPGQAAVTVGETIASGEDTYTCVWDFRLNGNYLHNVQFTLGFSLNGSSNGWGSPESAVNPDGTRTGVARYGVTQPNGFYAGYAATDLARRTAAYQKVTGHWTVPKAHCTPGTISLAAVWVGITSDASDRSLLAQLGTVSRCDAGVPAYFMWWEMFPAPSVPLDQPLQPGDSITASVPFQKGRFQLTIDNPN